ncbi:MAG: acetyl ornithine aminotransferase family protein [Acidobacteria bacterium]|nr:acetyl ornithine aminotransferase family protein [Acidobacteriota bacterium]
MNDKLPSVRLPLPGPKAREWIERDRARVSTSYTRVYPLVAEAGRGAVVWDPDGNRFLDFAAGIAVCSTGHCHPEVVAAIREQAERLIHISGTDFYYLPQVRLAETMGEIAPMRGEVRVYFGNSGTEAMEAAIKLARYKTGRQHIVAFFGGFHGRTLGALSLTASKWVQRAGFSPLLSSVHHVPYAYCFRCPVNRRVADCDVECFGLLEEFHFRRLVPPSEIAAIVVEPVQGEGGYVVPPAKFLRRIREVADRHGILLIADEVQSGMGRTGKMFAIEHFGVEPDIVTVAKGIASGMPLGLMVARKELMDWPPGAHASTFGGNPLSCAAALATIRLLRGGLVENVRVQGDRLRDRLRGLQERMPAIGEVRGLGLMIGVEMVRPKDGAPDAGLRDRVIQAAFRRGLLLLGCGDNTVRFSPPLVVDSDQVDAAFDLFRASLEEALAPGEPR